MRSGRKLRDAPRLEVGLVRQAGTPADLLELIGQDSLERSEAALERKASIRFELGHPKRLRFGWAATEPGDRSPPRPPAPPTPCASPRSRSSTSGRSPGPR